MRRRFPINGDGPKPSELFRSRVFPIQCLLSKKGLDRYHSLLEKKTKLDDSLAEEIAQALKKWALSFRATHYSHWFQPLTHLMAEKQDAFLMWQDSSHALMIETFRGQDLLRGESDASSFPTGGLRATHEARGYTMWDPSSLPFLWEQSGRVTLYIPSLFFSWKGEALDHKIPLLRSEEKLERVVLRLLKLCKVPAKRVFSTLGIEQEYFLIPKKWLSQRADLLLTGRTIVGAKSVKGQQLEDHYFSHIKTSLLNFMQEIEQTALTMGIPLKTLHSEVAPSQFECAPLFEPSPLAVDHNVILMELMRQVAMKHELVCLFHEKPFAHLNGSGKHNNWSLATDTGLNLLDPLGDSTLFFILLTAVIVAVHDHAALLRASIGSAANDFRLGGSEAPPTILSVYLGETLEAMVQQLIEGQELSLKKNHLIHLNLSYLSECKLDASDRNRTSFFAFTGNKFEFRAVGASAHSAWPITLLNAIVADSLQLILDDIGSHDIFSSLRKHLKRAKSVLFSGNGYSLEWEKEAEKRGLPNIRKSPHAYPQLLEKKTIQALQGVLSEQELEGRFEVLNEQYVKTLSVELHLFIELFRTQILPAVLEDLKKRGESFSRIESAIRAVDELEEKEARLHNLGWEAKAKAFADVLLPEMEKARGLIDSLEMWVDARLWPLPKYREMLFSV